MANLSSLTVSAKPEGEAVTGDESQFALEFALVVLETSPDTSEHRVRQKERFSALLADAKGSLSAQEYADLVAVVKSWETGDELENLMNGWLKCISKAEDVNNIDLVGYDRRTKKSSLNPTLESDLTKAGMFPVESAETGGSQKPSSATWSSRGSDAQEEQ